MTVSWWPERITSLVMYVYSAEEWCRLMTLLPHLTRLRTLYLHENTCDFGEMEDEDLGWGQIAVESLHLTLYRQMAHFIPHFTRRRFLSLKKLVLDYKWPTQDDLEPVFERCLEMVAEKVTLESVEIRTHERKQVRFDFNLHYG